MLQSPAPLYCHGPMDTPQPGYGTLSGLPLATPKGRPDNWRPAVRQAYAGLCAPEESLRMPAVIKACRDGWPDLKDTLLQLLVDDPSPRVRTQILTTVAGQFNFRDRDPLFRAAEDPSVDVRRALCKMLSPRHLLSNRHVLPVMLVLASSSEPDFAAEALQALTSNAASGAYSREPDEKEMREIANYVRHRAWDPRLPDRLAGALSKSTQPLDSYPGMDPTVRRANEIFIRTGVQAVMAIATRVNAILLADRDAELAAATPATARRTPGL